MLCYAMLLFCFCFVVVAGGAKQLSVFCLLYKDHRIERECVNTCVCERERGKVCVSRRGCQGQEQNGNGNGKDSKLHNKLTISTLKLKLEGKQSK